MGRPNKIEELGLGPEITALRAKGYSLRQIVEHFASVKLNLATVQRYLAVNPGPTGPRELTEQAKQTTRLVVAQSTAREIDRDLECLNNARDRLDQIVVNAAYLNQQGQWVPVDERTLVVAAKALADVVGKRNSLTGKRVLVDVTQTSKHEIVFGHRMREVSMDLFGAHNLTRSTPLELEPATEGEHAND